MMGGRAQELQILLVEDSAADADLTMDALRSSGMINRVRWVKDGAAALDFLIGQDGGAAEQLRLKLVLLDLRLPRVDGFEVLRALRAGLRTRRLPVVVLTSSHEAIDLARAYEIGANSYLEKPVESEAFMRAVSEMGLYWMLLNELPEQRR